MRCGLVLALALAGCSADGSAIANNAAQAPPAPRRSCIAPVGPSNIGNCDFGPVERMRGVWVTGFELSAFLPGETAIPTNRDPRLNGLSLAFAPGASPDPALRRALDALGTTGAAAIEFDGRRARNGEVVIVDRIISQRMLGPLPRR